MSKVINIKENLSGNAISFVWREGNSLFKKQIKHFADNEEYALCHPELQGYVPRFIRRLDLETIEMEFIEATPITDPDEFMGCYEDVIHRLQEAGLRHGDLTRYAVIPRNNRPILVDWAESRIIWDERPDKRPEGDGYWLKRTMEELCGL